MITVSKAKFDVLSKHVSCDLIANESPIHTHMIEGVEYVAVGSCGNESISCMKVVDYYSYTGKEKPQTYSEARWDEADGGEKRYYKGMIVKTTKNQKKIMVGERVEIHWIEDKKQLNLFG